MLVYELAGQMIYNRIFARKGSFAVLAEAP